MRSRAGRVGLGAGAAVCTLLVATLQARAADSVTTADGTVLVAWEQPGPGATVAPGERGSAIAYSVSDASGTRYGTVTATGDDAGDTAPDLALGETSGSPVLVWSRFDGVFFKIAYARFGQGAWTDVHFLTFGRGNDRLPHLGTSSTGSYLFWVGPGKRYFYAPVELSGGRLLAVPQPLHLETLSLPGQSGTRGGNDAPVVLPHNDSVYQTPSATIQGGNDVPVVIGKGGGSKGGGKTSSVWGMGPGGGCRYLVLALPDRAATFLRVVSFLNGITIELARVPLPAGAPEGFAAATAEGYGRSICR